MNAKLQRPFRQIVRDVRRFLSSDCGRPALAWAAFLLLVYLTINGLNVANSYVGRDFMTAVADRQSGPYERLAVLYFGVFMALTAGAVFARFAEERLRLLWRTWLTRDLIERYVSHHVYYHLSERTEIDNPDERITEDVKSYAQSTLAFLLLTLNASITSLAFLGVLWLIDRWLVFVAVAYAALGSGATILLGRPLVQLANLQLKKEANFRFELIQVREAAVAIAVTGVERSVRGDLRARLSDLVANNRAIIAVTRNLGFFTNGYNYLIQLIPLLIIAPRYMRGHVEFGVVTQSAMAFAQVLGALSLIVTQFETLSSLAAVTSRLSAIEDAIEQAGAPSTSAIQVVEQGDRLTFEKLTLRAPRGHVTLVNELSLSLAPGENLLLPGSNGDANAALFLATAGIGQEGDGRIVRPPDGQLLFVPLRPNAPVGTIRSFLSSGRELGSQQIDEVVHQVGIGHVIEAAGGLDADLDDAGIAALGDQHLLGFARVLLARPRFVFLDRTGEGLPPDRVGGLYEALAAASITVVSIGNEHVLTPYHNARLVIRAGGGWQVVPATQNALA